MFRRGAEGAEDAEDEDDDWQLDTNSNVAAVSRAKRHLWQVFIRKLLLR
jgi:hypothetical protein